jgi:hypothetical protein
MEVSRKKKSEFDCVFRLGNDNNFFLNIELLRKLFSSDFFEAFVMYIETKITESLKSFNDFNLHIDTNLICTGDLLEYDKILTFSKMLHKFTDKLKQIYIYNSSILITNLIYLLNASLNVDITKKIIFSSTIKKTEFDNKYT